MPIFDGLDQANLKKIDTLFEMGTYEKDQMIFEQGQLATHLYVLLKGEVLIRYKPYDGPALNVARIQAGGVFGWSAAMRRSSYTSGAEALVQCEVARLCGEELHQLCETHPDIGILVLERLAGVIAERLRSTHSQILSILCEGMEMDDEFRRRLTTHD